MPEDTLIDAFKRIFKPIIAEAMSETKPVSQNKPTKRLYTRQQVQEMLGIKKTAFYDYVKRNKIVLLTFEGKRYVDADRLDAAIEEREVARDKHN